MSTGDSSTQILFSVPDHADATRRIELRRADMDYIERRRRPSPTVTEIERAVRVPDFRRRDPRAQRERLYKRDVGPTTWLRVVVEWNLSTRRGRVYNAIPMRRIPIKDRQ